MFEAPSSVAPAVTNRAQHQRNTPRCPRRAPGPSRGGTPASGWHRHRHLRVAGLFGNHANQRRGADSVIPRPIQPPADDLPSWPPQRRIGPHDPGTSTDTPRMQIPHQRRARTRSTRPADHRGKSRAACSIVFIALLPSAIRPFPSSSNTVPGSRESTPLASRSNSCAIAAWQLEQAFSASYQRTGILTVGKFLIYDAKAPAVSLGPIASCAHPRSVRRLWL